MAKMHAGEKAAAFRHGARSSIEELRDKLLFTMIAGYTFTIMLAVIDWMTVSGYNLNSTVCAASIGFLLGTSYADTVTWRAMRSRLKELDREERIEKAIATLETDIAREKGGHRAKTKRGRGVAAR